MSAQPQTTGSAVERVITEWRSILQGSQVFTSVYQTTPALRDALSKLARDGDRLPALLAAVDKALAAWDAVPITKSVKMPPELKSALAELRAIQQQMK